MSQPQNSFNEYPFKKDTFAFEKRNGYSKNHKLFVTVLKIIGFLEPALPAKPIFSTSMLLTWALQATLAEQASLQI